MHKELTAETRLYLMDSGLMELQEREITTCIHILAFFRVPQACCSLKLYARLNILSAATTKARHGSQSVQHLYTEMTFLNKTFFD